MKIYQAVYSVSGKLEKKGRVIRSLTVWYAGMWNLQRLRSESLLVAWLFYDCYATDWTSLGVSKLKRRLHKLVESIPVKISLEITYHN